MKNYKGSQKIGQLDTRKGGYFYLTIPADIVDKFKNRRQTRFICTLDKKLVFQCGLNHLGDGNFFVILSSKNLKTIGKNSGDTIQFELKEDPDPLGVKLPEVLEALLEQEEDFKTRFDQLSLGKKRSVIYAVSKIKDVDKQIVNARKLVVDVQKPRKRKE